MRGRFCLLDPGGYLLSRRPRNGRGASGLKPAPTAPLLAVPPPRCIPHSGRSAPTCLPSSAARRLDSSPGERVKCQNLTKNNPMHRMGLFLLDPGGYLLSRTVSSQVPSAYEGLTSVFGMGTGGTLQLNHRKGVVFVVNTLKTA